MWMVLFAVSELVCAGTSLTEPLDGVLASRENRGRNNQAARSRVGKSLGSREQGK